MTLAWRLIFSAVPVSSARILCGDGWVVFLLRLESQWNHVYLFPGYAHTHRTTYLITHLHHTSHYKHTNTHTTYNPPHTHLCTHRVKPSHVLPCIHFFPPSLGHLLCISCTCLSSLQRSGISLSPPKPHPGWCLALKTPCHGYHSHPLCHLVCLLANSRLEPRL